MIDEPPARSSEPPPASRSGVSPMSFAEATAWSSGVVLAFWVLMVAVSRHEGEGARGAGELVGGMACQAITYLLGLFLILRMHAPEASIRDFIGVRRTHVAFYPLAILTGVAIEIPIQSLYVILTRRWPLPEGGDGGIAEMFTHASTPMRAAMGSMIVLFGPLVEEIFFRGALFRPLLRRNPAALVVTFTSVFFAISHGVPQTVVPIAFVGIFMGILRWQSGSLVPSLLLHATFNAFPFVAQAISGAADDDTMPPLWMNASSGALALLLAALALWLGARSLSAAEARARDFG